MDLIYANCELNIAVAHALDSSQGCFVDRNPDFIQTAYVYAPIAMGLDPFPLHSTGQKSTGEAAEVYALHEDASEAAAMSQVNLVTIFAGRHDFSSSLH
jgi:hypothetical protein